jgi:GWxTD domain-containing protein
MSDVVVAAHMRVLSAGEEPRAAEMKRGRYAIERGARVTIVPSEPRLWYYVELYRQGADSVAQLELRVLPEGKDSALVRVTRNVAVGARGTVDAAALPIQGLPPGDYRFSITARSGGHEERREALFTMGSFETATPVAAAAPTGASESALFDRYFAPNVLSDADANDLLDALTYSAPGAQVASEQRKLPIEAKRRFLARYWSQVADPNPGTAGHELLMEYMQRVMHVARNYGEGSRSGRSPFATDRGRIYLRYGSPDVSQDVQLSSSNKHLLMWKYTGRRALKYIFLDESGFQTFNLIVTTDPQEHTLPDWADRVNDVDAIRQIRSF